jgi:hypothetical protein
LRADPTEVDEIFQEMSSESKALMKQIIDITWYMRGGVSYDEAWGLSPIERKRMIELIKDNIQRTHDSGMPLV